MTSSDELFYNSYIVQSYYRQDLRKAGLQTVSRVTSADRSGVLQIFTYPPFMLVNVFHSRQMAR